VMLTRTVENRHVKCADYFPCEQGTRRAPCLPACTTFHGSQPVKHSCPLFFGGYHRLLVHSLDSSRKSARGAPMCYMRPLAFAHLAGAEMKVPQRRSRCSLLCTGEEMTSGGYTVKVLDVLDISEDITRRTMQITDQVGGSAASPCSLRTASP
jgi:hypothetical protein